jgi:predicted ferric reductase
MVVFVWTCINIALFIEACYRWQKRANELIIQHKFEPQWAGYHPWYVMIARGFGQLLNFNCALILMPTMRTLLNVLRSLKFGVVLPLDKNIIFHRFLAYFIAICTAGHTIGHYLNYSCCHRMYLKQDGKTVEPTAWAAMWGDKYGLTGNIITLIMVVMYSAATGAYRRSNNFTVFWYTHHLFLFFFCGLLIHARNFWMWFLGPGLLYIAERFLRNVRGASEAIVKKTTGLPSLVLHLELEKPAFSYEAGQYCFLNCPTISKHEWHPFTISSAPEEENLTFHIRCAGDWTGKLRDLFVPEGTGIVNKPTTANGEDYLIRVDGPFGTCAEYVYNFEYIMLVAAGIGVTPYASLLKHFKHMLRHPEKHHRKLKVKRCFFYWINRDKGSWEWFSELLDELEHEFPNFFEVHTYMTGALRPDEIKKIIDTSIEVRTFSPQSPQSPSDTKYLARANYSYTPQARDEIRLSVGDEIEVTERDVGGWWTGTNLITKQSGFFPGEYVNMVDSVTKMREGKNRHYGRPNWKEEFGHVRTHIESVTPNIRDLSLRPQAGIFICGPSALSKQLYKTSQQQSKDSSVLFKFHKENF